MSEGSLPPFGPVKVLLLLKTLRPTRLKWTLGRLLVRKRSDGAPRENLPRADRAISNYLDAYAANLERAVRLEEKARRLEEAGTPSESARNQAERARGEVVSGLVALRASFVGATGREGALAFDRAVELLCPAFAPRRLTSVPDRASAGAPLASSSRTGAIRRCHPRSCVPPGRSAG